MTIGIYKITNKLDNKIYIGSSINIEARLRKHKSSLKNNKHTNVHLQRSYNLVGFNNLEFKIIEVTKKEEQYQREQFYIDLYHLPNHEIGYNIRKEAKTNKGIKHSESTKRKLSQITKNHWKNEKIKNSFLLNINNVMEKRKRKIIELNSGLIANSVAEAGRKFNLDPRRVSSGARQMCAVFGFNFRFLDENDNPITKTKICPNKRVLNSKTGIIYDSITHASFMTKISETAISRNAKKVRKIGGKNGEWIFEFV